MEFSHGFTSWAKAQSSPCVVISNFKEGEAVCRECGNKFDDNLDPNDTICKTCKDWMVKGKKPLKLSGHINWEARNDLIHEDNEANKGLPKEGQPKF